MKEFVPFGFVADGNFLGFFPFKILVGMKDLFSGLRGVKKYFIHPFPFLFFKNSVYKSQPFYIRHQQLIL